MVEEGGSRACKSWFNGLRNREVCTLARKSALRKGRGIFFFLSYHLEGLVVSASDRLVLAASDWRLPSDDDDEDEPCRLHIGGKLFAGPFPLSALT